ncbi:MAG: DUF423 domain-containing protein [Alphaproteobacteria bacterium]|jgi:uncharacterized membrane protein YgdD (TMEM256/DUF423 family)|nr:DUF423 domain-containing protein [Alphaproteobacteria bacterium]
MRLWLFLAALNGLLAAAAGAYGSHAPVVTESAHRDVFMTAVQYHMWHALALFAVAWLASRPDAPGSTAVRVAGWAFTAGIVLFSGSLYALGVTGSVPVPGAAPAGGLSFFVGWAALIWVALARK